MHQKIELINTIKYISSKSLCNACQGIIGDIYITPIEKIILPICKQTLCCCLCYCSQLHGCAKLNNGLSKDIATIILTRGVFHHFVYLYGTLDINSTLIQEQIYAQYNGEVCGQFTCCTITNIIQMCSPGITYETICVHYLSRQ